MPHLVDRHDVSPAPPWSPLPAGGRARLRRVRPGVLLGGQLRCLGVARRAPRRQRAGRLASLHRRPGRPDRRARRHQPHRPHPPRRRRRRPPLGRAVRRSLLDPRRRRVGGAMGDRPVDRRARGPARLPGDPRSRAHQGVGRLPARRQVALHRRLARLEPRSPRPHGVPRTPAGTRGRRRPRRSPAWPSGIASPRSCLATAPATSATQTICTNASCASSAAWAAQPLDESTSPRGPACRAADASARGRRQGPAVACVSRAPDVPSHRRQPGGTAAAGELHRHLRVAVIWAATGATESSPSVQGPVAAIPPCRRQTAAIRRIAGGSHARRELALACLEVPGQPRDLDRQPGRDLIAGGVVVIGLRLLQPLEARQLQRELALLRPQLVVSRHAPCLSTGSECAPSPDLLTTPQRGYSTRSLLSGTTQARVVSGSVGDRERWARSPHGDHLSS